MPRRCAQRGVNCALSQRLERLTPREREVMALVVTGYLNKQVASEPATVEKRSRHVAHAIHRWNSSSPSAQISPQAGIRCQGDLAKPQKPIRT
ncbi:LuxR C-terminal-related transcriptional regulator [Paraburkholderia gardini]|uniref:LuxR C-terminal-related transcriptional regulator n=1 Tax=Paraburkholderia gardini TaxID=2823469 RepID=UPI0038993910